MKTPDIERGRRLLRELLPWARAEARKGDIIYEAQSALGNTAAAHVTLANLDALMIYPAPLGGWHADVLLKDAPPGAPNTMGTPVGQPCRTKPEAEEIGKRLLVMLCRLAAQNEANKTLPPAPVFMLHGHTFRLLPELYQIALALAPAGAGGPNGGYESKERAIERIEETLAEFCPDGFDGKAFNSWDGMKKAELLTVLHIAALTGVYVYPPRRDATPSGHRASDVRH